MLGFLVVKSVEREREREREREKMRERRSLCSI
jgi:hypothetical protein